MDVVTATSALQNCVAAGPTADGAARVEEWPRRDVEGRLRALSQKAPRLGVAEAWSSGAVPLVANLDALNAIAFDKGCWARVDSKSQVPGPVRRRLMPVALHETDVVHSAARAEPPADPVPFAPLSVEYPAVGA